MPDHPYATRHNKVAEHRLVVEKMIGRYLLPGEVVHHKDGDPQNNNPDNLQLFGSNGEHLAFELKGRVPKWTEDGRRRIAAGIRKAHARKGHARNDAHKSRSRNSRPKK